MPKLTHIKSILIIGAGPIVIGQACEFDYAGTQACKALKEEGYKIILINSNPATIMTDMELADATYIEPITLESLEKIIIKEKPDALLPVLGGQTALNCTLALAKAGILEKHNVELLGTSIKSIELAENRKLFQGLMKSIGLQVPHAVTVHTLAEAKSALTQLSLPVVIRPSFTLGGSGAGIAKTEDEFIDLCKQAFAVSAQQEILIDEALIGWKEFELEVVRDKKDNCIIVCGVENLDPLGIHTGDSITVAPIQTLTDKEYQSMRQAAFSVLKAVGVETGGSNVQFAVHPKTGEMVVIEMNPRVSRSSALVSKASGFPIAKIAAKLAIGYTLDELKNDITGNQLPASFEPSLDYVVVKIPRFNVEKFPETSHARGPKMLSVGEVMAIGRTFTDALQKAMRSLEIGQQGFGDLYKYVDDVALKHVLTEAGPTQLWAIGEAFRREMSMLEIQQLTHIDQWFLSEIQTIIQMEQEIPEHLSPEMLKLYKKNGFSDARLATLLNSDVEKTQPVYKRIDSCAGEYPTSTAYLYSSYETVCEALPSNKEKMMIIGSGPNRIGQGIEFDYCCVHAAKALSAAGYETIMVNCNPETVSTDYDVVDRLYCIPLTLEDILAVIQIEKPVGVFVQYGGQTPLHLVDGLAAANVPLLGVNTDVIQQTEDRHLFQQLLQTLALKQPKNCCVYSVAEGIASAKEIGFPLIVRPSFVLGGASMSVVNSLDELTQVLNKSFLAETVHPVLIEEYLHGAFEVDIDAITDGEDVFIPALLEHIESAGIHSGDSACITPPVHLPLRVQTALKQQIATIAKHLHLKGVFNVQCVVKGMSTYIIEVNPRASRTLPFLCKATGLPLIQIATNCALGKKLSSQNIPLSVDLPFYCVKEAVLPFGKFTQSPAILGPEMRSTGEVMGIGETPAEAYAKAQMGAGNILPKSGIAYLIALDDQQTQINMLAEKLEHLGFIVYRQDDDKDLDKSSLIIALNDLAYPSKAIQHVIRVAINHQICHATTYQAAVALVDAIAYHQQSELSVTSLQAQYPRIRYNKKIQHVLTGEELSPTDIKKLLTQAKHYKKARLHQQQSMELAGHQLAMLFDKPSLRTRLSFAIAIQELGGSVVESVSSTRKVETPEDQARVLNGYCHAIMVRTHEDAMLERMSTVATIPIINGLSNQYHPCQVLGDLLTIEEQLGYLHGLNLCYIGDGNNILHSLLLLAPQMGVNIHYACPPTRGPKQDILDRALAKTNQHTGQIHEFSSPIEAAKNADAVYTDVWASMGFEAEAADDLFDGFQVNEELMQHATPNAIFMHCLPMERGKEVSHTLADEPCSVIFQQSENRLHIQKAILMHCLGGAA